MSNMPADQGESQHTAGKIGPLAISRDFSILLMALVVVGLGFGIIAPIMPKFAEEKLGMDAASLGLAYSMFAVAFTVFMLPAGYWADRYGRKPVIVLGTALFGITTFALVLITDALQFAILRALEGVGAALVTPAAFALTADIVPQSKRGVAMGAEATAEMMGALGGPGLGGFLAAHVSYYSPFYVGAAMAFLCALLVGFIHAPKIVLSEARPSLFSMFQSWKRNASENRALYAITVRGAVMGVVQGLWNLGLIYFWYDRLALDTAEVGLAMSVGILVMLLGTIPAGAIADRIGRRPNMIFGGVLMVTGLSMNLVVGEFWQVLVIVAIADLGGAISNPAVGAMLADVMLEQERGRVMGAYHMIQGTGNIVGYSLLGILYESVSPEAPIALCAAMLAVATGIIAVFVSETYRAPSSKEAAVKRRASALDPPSDNGKVAEGKPPPSG